MFKLDYFSCSPDCCDMSTLTLLKDEQRVWSTTWDNLEFHHGMTRREIVEELEKEALKYNIHIDTKDAWAGDWKVIV
jgi:hypothetical protein